MVHQWVTKGSINNARRPGRGSVMRPTINEESDCLRKKNLRRRHSLPSFRLTYFHIVIAIVAASEEYLNT
jgi:hypothetical protein